MIDVTAWGAIKDQIKAEIKDKAPLVAEAYTELRKQVEAKGGKSIDPLDLGVLSVIWVNTIVNEIEHRMSEAQEE